MRRIAISLACFTFFSAAIAARAQEGIGEISAQGTGLFTKNTTGNGTLQQGTESGGLLVGYRHTIYRWLSAEAVYGYSRNTQLFYQSVGIARIQSDIHEATGGFVLSLPSIASLRPYVLAEGGALVFVPIKNVGSSLPGAERQARGTFVYGGGLDYALPGVRSHLLLRVEYRGLVYQAPDFASKSLSTDTWTHVAQPSAGFVFRF